ncbi:MAG TPA: class I SAM-dependent RNA methyltransferase [Gemmatimonadales bacterium]|nr:class I SAM-dependent RNA methyltransferase [Gemmatimonadales bacterium]
MVEKPYRASLQRGRAPAFPCFATTAPGLEGLLAHELTALGIRPYDQEPGGITFDADQRQLYTANLHLRTASRVVVRSAAFKAAHFAQLEKAAGGVEWGRWVRPGSAVHFRITSRKSRLYHQKAIADRLEAAVQRAVPDAVMVRTAETAETQMDLQQFIVRLAYDQCVISADSSGALLHQRGYRQAVAKAPLRETLAAAVLLGAEWDPATPLLDPMCGSGTIAIEAALLARRIPPGRRRRFAFEQWADFHPALWAEVQSEAEGRVLSAAPAPIHASDRDAGATEATRANAERAGVLGDLTIRQCALSAIEPPAGPGLLLTNPPYGLRIGEADQLRDLYARLGQLMSGPLAGWRLGLLVANQALAAQVAMRLTERWSTTNGGIRVALAVS